VPTSLPWRIPWVGSCASQNVLSNARSSPASGRTPRAPLRCARCGRCTLPHTSGWVCSTGITHRVEYTPGNCQKPFSAPQKQPSPNSASSSHPDRAARAHVRLRNAFPAPAFSRPAGQRSCRCRQLLFLHAAKHGFLLASGCQSAPSSPHAINTLFSLRIYAPRKPDKQPEINV